MFHSESTIRGNNYLDNFKLSFKLNEHCIIIFYEQTEIKDVRSNAEFECSFDSRSKIWPAGKL